MRLLATLPLAAALSLAACGPHVTVQSASAQAVLSADALYTAASAAGQLAVTAGKVDLATDRALDDKAYAALKTLREVRAGLTTTNLADAQQAFAAALADLNAVSK